MAKRSYKQNCALAQAVDVVGERWSLLLIRDLLVGPRRFRDLTQSLKGIGTNLLAARLKDLELAGILERRSRNGGTHTYALTQSGQALEPAVLALVRWGLVHGPQNQPDYHHQDDWDLVALKALFQPQRAGNLIIGVQFTSDTLTGWMKIDAGAVSIGLGQLATADLVVVATIADLFKGREPPESVLAAGDVANLRRFMSVFALRA
ncbi:MAG: winged helix-turn-helix transcriptional regulator [Woeseiaceae bacterium]